MANKYDKILGAYREADIVSVNGFNGPVVIDAANLGAGTGVFYNGVDVSTPNYVQFLFNGLTSADGSVTITQTATDIDISVPGGSGTSGIPQYNSDPVSPAAEDAWVLRTAGAPSEPAGVPVGILLAITSAGTTAGTDLYQFSYQTVEGTIKRITLS